jgi:hypothetical protein
MSEQNHNGKSLSKDLVNGFIFSELENFKKDYPEHPIPAMQDKRSLAIAWVSYYFKELVSEENIAYISSYVYQVMQEESYHYRYHGWMRIAALQAASFILTGNSYHRDGLLANISCGKLTNRTFIIESCSILCPLLSFTNDILREAVEYNLKTSQGYFEEGTVLYLCSEGEAQQKLDWLNRMKIEHPHHVKFFEKVFNAGGLYTDGFFVRIFSEAKSFFIFKLLSDPTTSFYQPNLFSPSQISFDLLVQKEKVHPLNDYYIDLSFLKAAHKQNEDDKIMDLSINQATRPSVTLYHFQSPEIKISIAARIQDDESLFIDGYDIGKKVEEAWGDSDYEYTMTLPKEEKEKLKIIISQTKPAIATDAELLEWLLKNFNHNYAYSAIKNLFERHELKYKTFSWT